MGFNLEKYQKTRWERRTEEFKITNSELIKFFGKDDKPVWILQTLTGTEVGLSEQAASNRKLSTEIMEALLDGRSEELIAHIKKLSGNVDEIPEMVVKRIHQFWYGMKEPKCTREFSVDLCRQHPTEFFAACIRIMNLSGHGMTPGKSQPSGVTKKSN